MSTFDGYRDANPSADAGDGQPAFGAVIAVHACSRIGMQASPPRSALGSWFRRR